MENYWNNISGILIDTNSENKLNVDIILETGEEQGLSDLEMLHINKIWQEPSSGEIGYLLEGCIEEFDLSELEKWQLKNIYESLQEEIELL